jgi:hypothetical protein
MILAALMLMMSWGALIDAVEMNGNEGEDQELNTFEPIQSLEEEPVIEYASSATSPGHVVFGQYISSDNCGHCSKTGGGSDTHHLLKNNFPMEYVYITYMSASYGDTDTARAGNVAPYNWAWSTGGAPDAYFGDRTDRNQGGASANYDTYDNEFSTGGGMASTTNDYTMGATISQNGANYDISISYGYTGSGSPASNMKLYAALVDKDCTGYSYSSGIPHGWNCWMGWLTSGDTYKSKSGGTGTSFASVTPSATSQSVSWTSVPTGVVPGGLSKAVVIGVLMSGNSVSAGGTSAHAYHAVDSTMNPMDLSVTDFTFENLDAQSSSGFQTGDMLELEATVGNTGAEDYSDGGQLQFYQISQNGQENAIGSSVQLNNLIVGQTQTLSTQFDTTSIQMDSNDPQTAFRFKMTGTSGENNPTNNALVVYAPHDMAPSTSKPIAAGTTSIPRGATLDFEVTGMSNDNVDDMSTMTAELETSESGTNQWISDWVSGGTLMGAGTGAERFVFTISPPNSAGSGSYDVRARMTDARSQTGEWSTVNNDAFTLMNGLPMVVTSDNLNEAPEDCRNQYPGQPTVKVETIERIDVAGLICDAETPLNQLVVSSTNPAFREWDPVTGEIEVLFNTVNTNPQGEVITQPLQVTINDGEESNSGTLNIMVIENGAPRWSSVPTQSFNEGSGTSVILTTYLTDTDSSGNSASPMALALTIEYISNTSLVTADLNGHTLNIDGVNEDVFGSAIVTIRATDADGQFTDNDVTVLIANVNDAPTLDASSFDDLRIKIDEEFNFDVVGNLYDVDDAIDPLYVTVSCDTWKSGSRYNPLDGAITAWFDSEGTHTITIVTTDVHDGSNAYDVTIDVVDSLPLSWSENAQSGDLMANADNLYINENPTFTVSHHSGLGLTDVVIEWQVCNSETGVCTDFGTESVANLDNEHVFNVTKNTGTMIFKDQVKITVSAMGSDGFERKTQSASTFDITEERPVVVVDDNTDDDTNSDQSNNAAAGPGIVVYGVVGAFIVALLIALTLGVMLLRGGKDEDLGMGYGATSPMAMPPAPMAATPPSAMVPDYTQLPAGGNYVTNDMGQTVYLSPDNTDWTMQPDNSFIRTR